MEWIREMGWEDRVFPKVLRLALTEHLMQIFIE